MNIAALDADDDGGVGGVGGVEVEDGFGVAAGIGAGDDQCAWDGGVGSPEFAELGEVWGRLVGCDGGVAGEEGLDVCGAGHFCRLSCGLSGCSLSVELWIVWLFVVGFCELEWNCSELI